MTYLTAKQLAMELDIDPFDILNMTTNADMVVQEGTPKYNVDQVFGYQLQNMSINLSDNEASLLSKIIDYSTGELETENRQEAWRRLCYINQIMQVLEPTQYESVMQEVGDAFEVLFERPENNALLRAKGLGVSVVPPGVIFGSGHRVLPSTRKARMSQLRDVKDTVRKLSDIVGKYFGISDIPEHVKSSKTKGTYASVMRKRYGNQDEVAA